MTEEKKAARPPKVVDFCLKSPLYEVYQYDENSSVTVFAIQFFEGVLDAFCSGCSKHSVLQRVRKPEYNDLTGLRNYVFTLWFECTRDSSHKMHFTFRAHAGTIQKIGQLPSLADLALPDFAKYRQVLGKEFHKELVRGIGLAAHGVGIGAFVYLRRVFEKLINDARSVAAVDDGWDEEKYSSSRISEKIQLLRNHLPSFLVQNRLIYGVLSAGVHELAESDCLDAFPVVLAGIELILDEKLAATQQQLKIQSASKSLLELAAQISEKSSGKT